MRTVCCLSALVAMAFFLTTCSNENESYSENYYASESVPNATPMQTLAPVTTPPPEPPSSRLQVVPTNTPAPTPPYRKVIYSLVNAVVGDRVQLSDIYWLVLDVQDERVLLITERLIARRNIYYTRRIIGGGVTWENSSIRYYLNSEFYYSLKPAIRNRIIEVELQNKSNPWWNTPGGRNTRDRIFLLSIEEVLRYFGDSGMVGRGIDICERNKYLHWDDKGIGAHRISDEYNYFRIAYLDNGDDFYWWLRTPGFNAWHIIDINRSGNICLLGAGANFNSIGIRPALWLCVNKNEIPDKDELADFSHCEQVIRVNNENVQYFKREYLQGAVVSDLFEPIKTHLFNEGFPYRIEMQPFGKIAPIESYYSASFIFFFDSTSHEVYENENLIRLSRKWAWPERDFTTSFEVKQIPNTTENEVVGWLKEKHEFYLFRYAFASHYARHLKPTRYVPYHTIVITAIDTTIGNFTFDAEEKIILVHNNNRSGVFVITYRFPAFARSRIGENYGSASRTFVLLD